MWLFSMIVRNIVGSAVHGAVGVDDDEPLVLEMTLRGGGEEATERVVWGAVDLKRFPNGLKGREMVGSGVSRGRVIIVGSTVGKVLVSEVLGMLLPNVTPSNFKFQ